MGKNFYQIEREAINFKSRIINRLDQVCIENRVYKIHLIGSLYVIMGYNGKVRKKTQTSKESALIDETERVIKTAMQMIEVINEIKDQAPQ